MQEKLRKEREPYEIVLTTPNKETIEKLNTMHARKITEQCQNTIDKSNATDKPKINGINKITNGIRLQCKSPEDAKLLRQEVNWDTAFKELSVHKPKYGIVVHRVSTAHITGIEDDDIRKSTIQEWGETNHIKIKSIKQLRRKPRNNKPTSPNCSIIIFTEDPHAADHCIKFGFFIDSERQPKVERYAPQYYITQCYNCYDYGHRAAHCKRKTKCGNCASEEHPPFTPCERMIYVHGSNEPSTINAVIHNANSIIATADACLRSEDNKYFRFIFRSFPRHGLRLTCENKHD